MKIIKEGKLPEPKTYRMTCNNCKTEFEYTDTDIQGNICYSLLNRSGKTIKCPFCNKKKLLAGFMKVEK